MIVAGLVFAAVGAIVHGYIFLLESIRWTAPRTRAVFGTTADEAEATRALAFNQGFYNLFLAASACVGIALTIAGHQAIGLTLVMAATGSMLLAGVVLIASDRSKARPAAIQAGPAAIAILLVLAGLLG